MNSATTFTGAPHSHGPRRNRLELTRSSLLVVPLSLAAGAALTTSTQLAMVSIALAVSLVVVQTASPRLLLIVLVAATFVTRFRITVAGFHFLPEHFLAACLLLRLMLAGKSSAISRVLTDRTVLLLGMFIAWEAGVSLLQAPQPAKSLPIVGWLALDWIILIVVLATWRDSVQLERLTARFNVSLAAIAVLLWLAYVGAGSALGTQGGYTSGGRAVFALSWEANALASTLAVWGLVGLSSRDAAVQRLARIGAPLAIAAIAVSYTRSAVIGLALGLIVWTASGDRLAARKVFRLAAITLGAVVVLGFVHQVATPVEKRFTKLLALNSGTAAFRMDSVQTASNDLTGFDFVVGRGAESFGQIHTDPTRPGQPAYIGELPVQILYDSGLIGFVLLATALASLRPFARKHTGRALGVLTVYLVAATATSPFWFGWTWILISLAIMTRPTPTKGMASP
jgi:hypothetical protein